MSSNETADEIPTPWEMSALDFHVSSFTAFQIAAESLHLPRSLPPDADVAMIRVTWTNGRQVVVRYTGEVEVHEGS